MLAFVAIVGIRVYAYKYIVVCISWLLWFPLVESLPPELLEYATGDMMNADPAVSTTGPHDTQHHTTPFH